MKDNDTRLRIHEGSIAVPPGYEDRTTNLFVPANPQQSPNLSIARDTLRDGEALAAYIDRQLGQLKARMPGHKLLARSAQLLGSGPTAILGERIDASYKNGGQLVHQRQAAFVTDPASAPLRVLIFTAASPTAFNDAFETLWRSWLSGYTSALDAA